MLSLFIFDAFGNAHLDPYPTFQYPLFSSIDTYTTTEVIRDDCAARNALNCITYWFNVHAYLLSKMDTRGIYFHRFYSPYRSIIPPYYYKIYIQSISHSFIFLTHILNCNHVCAVSFSLPTSEQTPLVQCPIPPIHPWGICHSRPLRLRLVFKRGIIS
jgi:hypothetical protein